VFTTSQISVTDDSDITLITSANTWTFGANGILTIPGQISVVGDPHVYTEIPVYDRISGYASAGGPNAISISQSDFANTGTLLTIGDTLVDSVNSAFTATISGEVYNDLNLYWIIPIGDTDPNNFTSSIDFTLRGARTWSYGLNGSLTFPDSTIQTTAFTGTIAYSNITGTPESGIGDYNPSNPIDWNGAEPTTISEAIDRLAALVKSLNSGTGA
jgi:hypothetical protein